jgi:HEPN domain-containing protein
MRNESVYEGKRWLAQAEQDLFWAKHLMESGGYYLACFLAQQVAEKAIKAFLYAQGEEMVFGHSVERLCATAALTNPEFAEKSRSWRILDGFYIPTRYPNGLPDGIPANIYNEETARTAINLADEVVNWIKSIIE